MTYLFCFQYVSKVDSWNILTEALSDIQISPTIFQTKIISHWFHYCSLCRRGNLSIYFYLYLKLLCLPILQVHVCFLYIQVQYQSEQFIDKNKDYVVPEHQDMLTASKCFFVSGLFPPVTEEATKSSNKSSKFSSIGSRFKVIFFLKIFLNFV